MNRITVNAVRQWMQDIDATDRTIARLMPAVRVIALAGCQEHFQQQRGPDGEPWPRLAHPRPDGSARVLQDTGRLMRSITGSVSARVLTLVASHPAANLMQYGGTIVPRRVKWLTIPVTKQAKRVGSPGRGRWKGPLFFRLFSGSAAGLFQPRKKGEPVLQYVLKKRVLIRKRQFVGFSEPTLRKIDRHLCEGMVTAVMRPFTANGTRPLTSGASWTGGTT